MKGLGFSQVEVCESVGKSLFLFVKRPKGLTMHLMTVESRRSVVVFFAYL